MKITIAGGSGFLGQKLQEFFTQKGHAVYILTRSTPKSDYHVQWDGKNIGAWCSKISDTDILINLSGRSIFGRWTKAFKNSLYKSRLEPTQVLGKSIQSGSIHPKVWINASAVGYFYGTSYKEHPRIESDVAGNTFMSTLCQDWEAAALANTNKTRVACVRFGVMLSSTGGAFKLIKTVFKLGFGGRLGHGKQAMNWVHVDDVCEAIDWIIQNKELEGPIHCVAPVISSNDTFSKELAVQLKSPYLAHVPGFILRVLFKDLASSLLESAPVSPKLLIDSGFSFKFPTLEVALTSLTTNKTR